MCYVYCLYIILWLLTVTPLRYVLCILFIYNTVAANCDTTTVCVMYNVVAVSTGAPHETHGEVNGFSLVYSGNFQIQANMNETGMVRVNIGIHPLGFQWHLPPGQSFPTPEVVLVRSSEGVGGLSRVFHSVFLNQLMPLTPNLMDHVGIGGDSRVGGSGGVNSDAMPSCSSTLKHGDDGIVLDITNKPDACTPTPDTKNETVYKSPCCPSTPPLLYTNMKHDTTNDHGIHSSSQHSHSHSHSTYNPPVLLNTWESKYFKIDHYNIIEMAKLVIL